MSFFNFREGWHIRTRQAVLLWFVLFMLIEGGIFYLRSRARKPSFVRSGSPVARQIDSLRRAAVHRDTIYPFNPNYLSDYKAYMLGIDTLALKRIREFRAKGNYFRSKAEFRSVSGISDSLYRILAPYIKIPSYNNFNRRHYSFTKKNNRVILKKDINTASAEDLQKVYGIGKILSNRIVRYRKKLGGFSIKEQLKDIYALSPEAYAELWKYFDIETPKKVRKIPLNKADMMQLRENPYIDEDLAEKIYEYRSLHGDFKKLTDLKKVPGFPVEKFQRIVLYLTLN